MLKAAAIASLIVLQAPQAVFRARVNFVEIDVSVLDRDHRPVKGLTARDFTILEDGVPQKIETFAEVALPLPSEPPARWWHRVPDGRGTNAGAADSSLLAIVIDDEGITPAGGTAAQRIAREIVDRTSPADRVAVYYTLVNGSSQDVTQDRALIAAAIDRFAPGRIVPEMLGPESGDTRRGGDRPQAAMATSQACPAIIGMVSEFARLAAAYPGRRKAAFVISERIPALAPGICFDAMMALYDHARRANLNVYPISPRRLTAIGDAEVKDKDRALASVSETSAQASAAQTLAANTGGVSIGQTNNSAALLDEVFDAHRSYYLIGFESSNAESLRELRTLSVKVGRDGARVRARAAYPGGLPAKGVTAAGTDGDMRAAAAALVPVDALPMEGVAIPFATRGGTGAIVVTTVAPRLPPEQTDINEEIEVHAALIDPHGKLKASASRKAQARGTLVAGAVSALRVPLVLDAPPGRYQARVAARSRAAGNIGSVFIDVTIPDPGRGALAFSGIALSVRRDSPAMDLPRRNTMFPFVPATRAIFRANEGVTAAARLHGNTAAIGVRCRVIDAREQPVWEAAASLEGADAHSADGLLATCVLPLHDVTPGAYLLEMTAQAGSTSASARTKFIIRP